MGKTADNSSFDGCMVFIIHLTIFNCFLWIDSSEHFIYYNIKAEDKLSFNMSVNCLKKNWHKNQLTLKQWSCSSNQPVGLFSGKVH